MSCGTPSGFTLRMFTPQDYGKVATLWQVTGIARPERRDSPDAIARTLDNGGFLLVLEDPGKKRLLASAWVTQDGRRAYLHHLSVHPDHQRRGLGRWILGEALKRIAAMGLDTKIEVRRDHPAMNLYRTLGFEKLGNYETPIWHCPEPQNELQKNYAEL